MLDDLLEPGLRLVICGTAAGRRSASIRFYYAGRGNKFWRTLAEVGLTPRQLSPSEYPLLQRFGIGLTDLLKAQAGMDSELQFGATAADELRARILQVKPGFLCFNGKLAAKTYLHVHRVSYGLQSATIGTTHLFVAPSTSGAANTFSNIEWWHEVAHLVRQQGSAEFKP